MQHFVCTCETHFADFNIKESESAWIIKSKKANKTNFYEFCLIYYFFLVFEIIYYELFFTTIIYYAILMVCMEMCIKRSILGTDSLICKCSSNCTYNIFFWRS